MQTNFTEQGPPPPSAVKCEDSKIPSSVLWRSATVVSLPEFISTKKDQTVRAIVVCLQSNLDKAKSIADVRKTNHSSLEYATAFHYPLYSSTIDIIHQTAMTGVVNFCPGSFHRLSNIRVMRASSCAALYVFFKTISQFQTSCLISRNFIMSVQNVD
jgi:hypothetical protein